jgi:O-glycosyl hydrolase
MTPMLPSWRSSGRRSAGLFATVALTLYAASPSLAAAPSNSIQWWVTSADKRQQLTEQPALVWRTEAGSNGERIEINPAATFQTILGLGSSLEPATCSNLWRMSPSNREHTVERLVSPTSGIGMNLMRICIGTPDFTGDPWYSYDDLAAGETDPELKRFSIERDLAYIVPVLKLAQQKNPNLLFFASPWSPPGWMKSNGTLIGGELLPRWYSVYAEYFVKFIRAYEAEGIPIYAVTIQNEPGVDRSRERNPRWHYPSCRWTGVQERDFIRDHLGPALRKAGLKAKIWCYDHNYNVKSTGDDPGLDYPRTILRDARAAALIDGVAFHGYEGRPSGMTVFHEEFPNVPIHFTEGSVFGIKGAVDLIERLRNWATSYSAWVLMLDDHGKPNNGPFDAKFATLALNTKTQKAEYLLDYYVYGQFMKFIQRGAVRVDSGESSHGLATVAFVNPDGHTVLVVANTDGQEKLLSLCYAGRTAPARLDGKSVATFIWAR